MFSYDLACVHQLDGEFLVHVLDLVEPLQTLLASDNPEPAVPPLETPMYYEQVQLHPLEVVITLTDTQPVLESMPMFIRMLGVTLLNLNNVALRVRFATEQRETKRAELVMGKFISRLALASI